MLKKIISWFKLLFSSGKVREIAVTFGQTVVVTASNTLNEFVNDTVNQALAKEAIQTVAGTGVTGNQALNDAVNLLKEKGLAKGREAANTLLRTLVQLVFAGLKLK